jgi:hypothetical protein
MGNREWKEDKNIRHPALSIQAKTALRNNLTKWL